MFPELPFNPSQNYFINGDMSLPQRPGTDGSTIASTGIYNVDRWRQIYVNQNLTAFGTSGRVDHETSQPAGRSDASINLNMNNAGPDTDFIRVVQRVESGFLRFVDNNKLVMVMKLKRRNTAKVDTVVKFSLYNPAAADTYTDLLMPSDPLFATARPLKAGGSIVGDLTLGDISDTEFETYYAVFDTPTTVGNGLEMGIQLVRPSNDPFDNFSFINVGECALYEGSALKPFRPAAMGVPGMELLLAQRYYEKSMDILTRADDDEADFCFYLGSNFQSVGVGPAIEFAVKKRISPSFSFFRRGGSGGGLGTWKIVRLSDESTAHVVPVFQVISKVRFVPRPGLNWGNGVVIRMEGNWAAEAEL